jgi:hypothetical protein
MRTAPSFILDAPTCRRWRRLCGGAWAATGAVLFAWALTAGLHDDLDPPRITVALLAAAAWLLARPALAAERLCLAWDGQSWLLHTPHPQPCEARVAVDLGGWLLLQLRPRDPGDTRRSRGQWVALAEADVGPNWHSLRCALYSARRMTDPVPSPISAPPEEVRPPPR